jgi:V8-like Glu-specific endopeptidase
MPGSSGAPVFDDDWKVVALHQGAGVWSNEHSKYLNNRGLRFSTILADRTLAGEFT